MCIVLLCSLVGCAQIDGSRNGNSEGNAGGQADGRVDTGFIVYGPDSYDSADTPVLVGKDEEAGTMTFLNLTLGKKYTLSYDGTTCFYDKYGSVMSLSQIEIGEIVDIRFVKPKKHLTTMSVASSGWTIKSTNRYVIDSVKKDVTIGEEIYNISSDVSYFSKDKAVELRDLIATDTLTFRGIGTTVYSVVVDNGHGYLRITGQQNFVGGWIEIGNKIIERVTDDMILTIPEGAYQVKISNSGTTSEKRITIFRNSESKLDFSDVVFDDPKTGNVLFSLTPSTAELYIDGEKADTSAAIEMTYGLHQLICRADGYTTITQYLNVGQPTAGIDIVLEEKDKNDSTNNTDSTSNSTGSGDSTNNSTDNTSAGNGTGNSTGTGDSGTGNGVGTGDTGTGAGTGTGDTGNGTADTGSGDGAGTGDTGTDGGTDGGTGNTENPGNTDSNTIVTSYYRVHIDSPENVEVYLDGSYVGVSPCSFKKMEGSHIITLSKEGYVPRSYTIFVDSEEKDVSFSFVELSAAE